MRNRANTLAAASAGLLLLAGCAPGGSGAYLLPSSFFYVGPRGDALVLLDQDTAARTTQTVPGGAAKVRLVVKDAPGHIVGGLLFTSIPSNNTITIPGLPAGVELKFDATVADQATVEVGRGKTKQALTANTTNAIPIPVFMNAGELSSTNTQSSAQTTNANRLSTRVTFAASDWFVVTPVVTAIDAQGNPVTCSPTYSMRSGFETDDEHGVTTTSTSPLLVATQNGTYNVQVDYTPNCPAGATQITRKVDFQKVATMSVAVD